MKASKVIAATILTSVLLAIGGTVAYAEGNTTSQGVTSSPENTPTSSGTQTGPIQTTKTQSEPAPSPLPSQKNTATTDTVSGTASTATSQPTEEKISKSAVPVTTSTGSPASDSSAALDTGKGHTPVTVCHNGSNLTIDDSALPAHLNHGDTQGECTVVVTSTDPDPGDELTEVWWLLPNGGTDQNVTWPQPLLPGPSVGCGQWAQVDTYHVRDVPKLTADLILTQGEDYNGIAVSWRFVYGGDCAPVIPDCPSGQEAQPTDNGYVCGPVDTPCNEKEAGCPGDTPPTPQQPTTPSIIPVTGTDSGSQTSTTDTRGTTLNVATTPHTETLAKTGSDDGMKVAFLVLIAIVALIVGTGAVLGARRKN